MGYERFHMSISWCYPLVLMHILDSICGNSPRNAPEHQDELSIRFCGLFGLQEKHLPKNIEL